MLVLNALIIQVKDEIDNVGHQLANARLRRAGMWEMQKNWETAREIYQSEAIPHLLELIQATEERMTQVKAAEEQAERKADDTTHDRDQYAVAHTRSVDDYRVQALLQRKSKHLSALHRCYFFLAGIFHEMEQEQQETEYYDKAADVRREILSRAEERVCMAARDIGKEKCSDIDFIYAGQFLQERYHEAFKANPASNWSKLTKGDNTFLI